MIYIDYPCDRCVHQRENIDGWRCACDAFPDGTPDWIYRTNIRNLKECNNGIGYEKKSDELSGAMHPHGAFLRRRKADGSKKPREPKLSGFWCARRDLNPHVRSGH